MGKDKELFSFSKLSAFETCKRNYYYTYIQGIRGGDNIYSFLGTTAHNLTEELYKNEITKEEAIPKFLEAVDDADIIGLTWMSESVKDKYVACMLHYFRNFEPVRGDNITIEEYFEIDICDITLRGYIDMYYILDNTLYIIDFKTSSKFSKKELVHKQRQLFLYAVALRKKYPDMDIKIGFDMLKYAKNQRGTLKERVEFDELSDFGDGMVWVDFDEESVKDLENFVETTYNNIEDLKIIGSMSEWEMIHPQAKSFFCTTLCGHRTKCLQFIE